jgi:hypothetical protein
VPIIHSFDEAFFRDKFYDQQRPFGHGYVVCAMIVDLALDALVDSL